MEDIEQWPRPRRAPEEWEPFMKGLFGEIRRERRRRRLREFAAAACLGLALWTGWKFAGKGPAEPLLAEIPTTSAPLFQPAEGVGTAPFVMVCAQ